MHPAVKYLESPQYVRDVYGAGGLTERNLVVRPMFELIPDHLPQPRGVMYARCDWCEESCNDPS